MSKTPRTDASCGWAVNQRGMIKTETIIQDENGPFVLADDARELELENAELRKSHGEIYIALKTGEADHTKWPKQIEQLRKENQALRDALERSHSEQSYQPTQHVQSALICIREAQSIVEDKYFHYDELGKKHAITYIAAALRYAHSSLCAYQSEKAKGGAA